MSKLPSRDLFELIKSLSKSEKRYFKLFASWHVLGDGNNYVKLFDALEKQTIYIEQEIKKKVKARRFDLLKSHLYKILLQSLDAYHSTSSSEKILRRQINYIEILVQKNLYTQAKKILAQAKKSATNHGHLLMVLNLFRLENNIIRSEQFSGKQSNNLLRSYSEEDAILKDYSVERRYCFLNSDLLHHTRKIGTIRKASDVKKYNAVLKSMAKDDIPIHTSFLRQFYFLHTHVLYHYFTSEQHFPKALQHSKKLLDLFEAQPAQKIEHHGQYLSSLNQYLILSAALNKEKDFHETIKKIREFPILLTQKGKKNLSKEIEVTVFAMTYPNELVRFVLTKRYDMAIELMLKLEELLPYYLPKSNKYVQVLVCFNAMALYFNTGNYLQSKIWLNKLIHETDLSLREDIQCLARVAELIITFELKDIDRIEYLIKSTYRFLYKRNRIYKFETTIMNFIRKRLFKDNTERELIPAFKELKKELVLISKNKFEKSILGIFDVISWLESKIENRSFTEIINEKSQPSIAKE